MKLNSTGNYRVTEGEMFIEDPNSGKKMLFLLDAKNNLVVRSMLEDEIKDVISKAETTNSEKRKMMRYLSKNLPKEDSQFYFFVAEKIVEKPKNKSWNSIYESERRVIGYGYRKPLSIEMFVFSKWKSNTMKILDMIAEIGNYYKIPNGQKVINPNYKFSK